jgi:branched-chain amino acid transport system ATP-binding protein
MEERGIVLELTDVVVSYGALRVLSGINIQVRKGEIVALLGPNASGKTTLMHAIAGLLRPASGGISFEGRSIQAIAVERLVRMGISLVPEGKLLFGAMKTSENLELGAYHLGKKNNRREIDSTADRIYKLFPVLKARKNQIAATLSGGEQQMLAVGRALMSRPRLLLLDEPSLGLSPLLTQELMVALSRLRDDGLTILLSEQNAIAALGIADRGYVMSEGNIVLEGSSVELQSVDKIRTAYLGK